MAGCFYEPLAADEIRLIRFSPGNALVANLEKKLLHGAPPYVALSYTWGRAPYRKGRPLSAKYNFMLNDHIFDVQENLHDALSHLVPQVIENHCHLWVDAICINQDDPVERSKQILHMKYIYEHATTVFGWLGVPFDKEETSLAIRLMRKFNIVLRDGLAKHNGDMSIVATEISPSNKDIYPEPDTDCYKGWIGIREIFNQTYWNRIWIYQEATGTAPTRFYCGNAFFDMILICASVYMAHHFAEFTDNDFPFSDVARGPIFGFQAFRDEGLVKYGDTLLDLLSSLRPTQSSEPRDKIYAPLGFASDLSPSSIVPDYSKPLEEVYKDVVRFSLSQPDHGLGVLGHVTHLSSDSKEFITKYRDTGFFCSWVPDFRKFVGPSPFETKVADGTPAYHACGPHITHDASIEEGSRLILRGFKVDEITELSSIWDTNAFSTAKSQSWAPDIPDAIYAPTGQTMDEAFLITVLADMNVQTKSRGHKVDFGLINAREDEMSPDQSARRNRMNIALKTNSGVRRLGWTKHGRMGLMSPAARVGDVLYVLCGGQMIYILRNKKAEIFEYVGNAYVHGIMDGELFTGENTIVGEKEMVVLE
ncbi:MAG: hypothetical protein Q9209_007387 [Squamulea sp. 1 TL-2023]